MKQFILITALLISSICGLSHAQRGMIRGKGAILLDARRMTLAGQMSATGEVNGGTITFKKR
jgi:hypothetical protein